MRMGGGCLRGVPALEDMLEECGEFGIWGPFNRNLGEDCFFFCFVFLSSTFSSSSSATSVRLKIQDCAGEILVGSKR